jgi:hypothetical protein
MKTTSVSGCEGKKGQPNEGVVIRFDSEQHPPDWIEVFLPADFIQGCAEYIDGGREKPPEVE